MIVILESFSHQNLDTFPMAAKINFDLDNDLYVEIGVLQMEKSNLCEFIQIPARRRTVFSEKIMTENLDRSSIDCRNDGDILFAF